MTISLSQRVLTVAGTGEPGYSGDGGDAVAASLNEPKHVAVGPRGVLFIADAENHLVRKIDPTTGIISTVAGSPPPASKGSPAARRSVSPAAAEGDDDPLADPPVRGAERFAQMRDLSGTVRFVIAQREDGRIVEGPDGSGKVRLNFPSAVAVDADGHVYIADTMNHRVRKVDAGTGAVTTVAGNGQRKFSGDGGPATEASLSEPACVAVDSRRHRLYIADQGNHRVRMVDLASGSIVTLAGTGEAAYHGDGQAAVDACLSGPSGLAVGPNGEVYVADTFNGRIRLVDLANGLIATVVGDGGEYRYEGRAGEISTSLSRPHGIALEADGSLLITDSDSHLIRRWNRSTKLITLLVGNGLAQFRGDGGAPEETSLNYPFGVAVDVGGAVYIADTFNHRIRKLAA